jgi:hypothetical protein
MRSGPSRYYNLIIVEPDALSEIPLPRERPGFSLECGRVLVCLGRPDAAFRPQLLRIIEGKDRKPYSKDTGPFLLLPATKGAVAS